MSGVLGRASAAACTWSNLGGYRLPVAGDAEVVLDHLQQPTSPSIWVNSCASRSSRVSLAIDTGSAVCSRSPPDPPPRRHRSRSFHALTALWIGPPLLERRLSRLTWW